MYTTVNVFQLKSICAHRLNISFKTLMLRKNSERSYAEELRVQIGYKLRDKMA